MHAIEVHNLAHHYNGRTIYQDLTFSVQEGSICGLLGKNGQGKTTLVNILMGFLEPAGGHCLVLGKKAHDLPPATRRRIGLLHEGHLAYAFMTIDQTHRFFQGCYPGWNSDLFYHLVDKMGLPRSQRVGTMSCGQRSQVVLGTIMAQNPDLLILDDYSMGLDAGYRRLFLDVLHDFAAQGHKTIFVTSHIIQDMEQLVDTLIFLDQGEILHISLDTFMTDFCKYVFHHPDPIKLPRDQLIINCEQRGDRISLYSWAEAATVQQHLVDLGIPARDLCRHPMTLEDGFIGLLGKY
jgi:ABC-2 type transport system ATP-binding protein